MDSFSLRRSDSPRLRIHSRERNKPGVVPFCPPPPLPSEEGGFSGPIPLFSEPLATEIATNSGTDQFGRSFVDDDPCKVVVRDLVDGLSSSTPPGGQMLLSQAPNPFSISNDSTSNLKPKVGAAPRRSRDGGSIPYTLEEEDDIERILITDSCSEEQKEEEPKGLSLVQHQSHGASQTERVGAGMYTDTITLVSPSHAKEGTVEVGVHLFHNTPIGNDEFYFASPDVLLTPPHNSSLVRRTSLPSPLPKQPLPLHPPPSWQNASTPARGVGGSFNEKITQSSSQNTFCSPHATPFRPSTSTQGISCTSQRLSGADSFAPSFPYAYSNDVHGGGVPTPMLRPPPLSNGTVTEPPTYVSISPSPFVIGASSTTQPITAGMSERSSPPLFPASPANLSSGETASSANGRAELLPRPPTPQLSQETCAQRSQSQQRRYCSPSSSHLPTPPPFLDEKEYHAVVGPRHHPLPPPMDAAYLQQNDGAMMMGSFGSRFSAPPSPPMLPLGRAAGATPSSLPQTGSPEMPLPWVIPPHPMHAPVGLPQQQAQSTVPFGCRPAMLSQPSSTAATPQRRRDPSSMVCPSPPLHAAESAPLSYGGLGPSESGNLIGGLRSCSSSFSPMALTSPPLHPQPSCSVSGSPSYSCLALKPHTVNSASEFSQGSRKTGKGKNRQAGSSYHPGRLPRSTYTSPSPSYEAGGGLHTSIASLQGGGGNVTPPSLSPSRHTLHRLNAPPLHHSALSVLMSDPVGEQAANIGGSSVETYRNEENRSASGASPFGKENSTSSLLSPAAIQQVLCMLRDQLGCRTLQTLLVKEVYGIDDDELKRLEALQQEEEALQQQKQVQQSAGSPVNKFINGKPVVLGVHQVYAPTTESHERFLASPFVQRLTQVITTSLAEIAQDPYGNFLLQKILLLAPSSERQKLLLNKSLYPYLPTVACSVHGTFPIQCWIDTIQSPTPLVDIHHVCNAELENFFPLYEAQEKEMKIMVEGLGQNMPHLLTNVNGGHVLAKLRHHFLGVLNFMKELQLFIRTSQDADDTSLIKSAEQLFQQQGQSLYHHLKVLHRSILVQLPTVCCQQQGSCAIQRWMEFFVALPPFMKPFFSEDASEEGQKNTGIMDAHNGIVDPFLSLAEAITAVSVSLAPDPYANYVLTRLLDLYMESYKDHDTRGSVEDNRVQLPIPDRLVQIMIHADGGQLSSQSYFPPQQQQQHLSVGMAGSPSDSIFGGHLSALTDLCCNKYASNVIEKLLRCSSEATVRTLCRLWMTPIVVSAAPYAGPTAYYPDSSSMLTHSQQSRQGYSVSSSPSSSHYGMMSSPTPSGRNGDVVPFMSALPIQAGSAPRSKYPLIAIALNSYGNYVIQTLLSVAPLDELVYPLTNEQFGGLQHDLCDVPNNFGSNAAAVNPSLSPFSSQCYGNVEDTAARLGILPLLQLYSSVWRSMSFGKKMETKIVEASERVRKNE